MRPKPRSFRDGQAGFTLIELVVVVGLIGVVLAILVMGVRRASDAFSLRKAATTVISEVRRAQSSAVADGVDYMVEFALANPGRINTYRTKLLTETRHRHSAAERLLTRLPLVFSHPAGCLRTRRATRTGHPAWRSMEGGRLSPHAHLQPTLRTSV